MTLALRELAGDDLSGYELTAGVIRHLHEYKLRDCSKLVLIYLANCFNPKNKTVFPKQETIAKMMDISITSVKKGINELIEKGLILKVKNYNRNRYIFTEKIKNTTDTIQPSTDTIQPLQQSESDCSYIEPINRNKITQTGGVMKKEIQDLNVIKNISFENRRILQEYAKSKNAKNIDAYVNTLIGNGSYKTILADCKKAKETTQLYLINEQEYHEHAKREKELFKTACSPMDFPREQAYDYVKRLCKEYQKKGYSKKLIEKWGFNF